MSEYCVCCGEEIPEGRMICPGCEIKMKETFGEDQDFEDFVLEGEYDGSYQEKE